MLQSLFIAYIAKTWASLVLRITELVNGQKTALTYLHKEMLTKRFSPTLKWETLSSNGTAVVADIVSLDSSLPLKRRDSMSKYSGAIPKIGMKMQMSESLMTQINIMRAQGANEAAIAKIVFEDTVKCLTGVYEQHERMFQEALSTGVTLVENPDNVGLGIRIDFGHPDENKYGVAFAWSDPATSTPIDDINNVIENATVNGDSIRYIMMNRITYGQFINSAQVRGAYAGSMGFTGANLPVLSEDQAKAVLSARFLGLELRVIDRIVKTERDGVRKNVRPWAENKVTFLTDLNVGGLVWGNLAETTNQNKAVSYTVTDDYILLKKWHENEPFAELTSSQCLALPVLDNVSSMYIMDVADVEQDAQTEGNATITIFDDSTVTVANLVTALNDLGISANTGMTDAQLLNIVNKLSKKNENALIELLEIPTVNAGTDSTSSSATKALLGTATAATGKTIASVLWSQVSGPNAAGFSAPTALSTNATGLITGTYVFKLTATDSAGIVASDNVSIVATVA